MDIKKRFRRRISVIEGATKRLGSDVAFTSNATLANLTGLSHVVERGKTYRYRVFADVSANASGGTKMAFKLNDGLTLTSLQNVSRAFTASAVAVARTTTATDQASLVAATAAHALVVLEGTFVVNAGGTIQLQGAQNASFGTATSFLTGTSFEVSEIV